jgi:hypothetical protein
MKYRLTHNFVLFLGSVALAAAAEFDTPAIVPIKDQPAARLEIAPPIPEVLALGRAVISFRTENLRIVPVYGTPAVAVSPRIGHLHITVDDVPWRWLHSSTEPINVANLPAGKHKVLIQLVDPAHRVLDSKTSVFEVPERPTAQAPASH